MIIHRVRFTIKACRHQRLTKVGESYGAVIVAASVEGNLLMSKHVPVWKRKSPKEIDSMPDVRRASKLVSVTAKAY